jgi:hypothetical protein
LGLKRAIFERRGGMFIQFLSIRFENYQTYKEILVSREESIQILLVVKLKLEKSDVTMEVAALSHTRGGSVIGELSNPTFNRC